MRVGTVTAAPYGGQARITNSGDAHDAVFDFVLLYGPTGDTGPQGPAGDKGEQGIGLDIKGSYSDFDLFAQDHPTGQVGEAYLVDGHLYVWDALQDDWVDAGNVTGPVGPAGPRGAAGPTGATGPKGPTGDAGPAGDAGPKGATGDRGPRGIQGERGDMGPTGADGTGVYVKGYFDTKGELPSTGADGDAYFVDGFLYVWSASLGDWREIGYMRGPQGLQGPDGPEGPEGPRGPEGPEGPEGPQGPIGDTGPTGPAATFEVTEDTPAAFRMNITTDSGVIATPNLRPAVEKYNADLSALGAGCEVKLENLVYRLEYLSNTTLRLYLRPADGVASVLADIKRSCQTNNSGVEGDQWDNDTITGQMTLDSSIDNRSNEIHKVRIRQQDPGTGLWSLCDVEMFASGNGSRVTIWVNWIENGVDLSGA